jgi:hypothetical protein
MEKDQLMTPKDIAALDQRLQNLYAEQWPGLTVAQAERWEVVLGQWSATLVNRALDEWIDLHTFKAPALRDLLGLVLDVAHQERLEASLRARANEANDLVDLRTGEILDQAAQRPDGELQAWAKEHVRMVAAGLCRAGRYEETALRCEDNMSTYPDSAQFWSALAAWWRSGAVGRPDFAGL